MTGKEVLVAGVVGIRAQRVRRAPETPFDGVDVLKLVHVRDECTPAPAPSLAWILPPPRTHHHKALR